MKKIFFAACLGMAAAGANMHAHASKAHIHGNAAMQVAVDGNRIEIEFQSPMDSLVGFEHVPRNERQRKAIQGVEDHFRSPATLFALTAEAKCSAQPAEVNLPFKTGEVAVQDRQSKEVHSDMEVSIRFQCEHPSALKGMEVNLFDAFSRLQRIDVQAISTRGQSAARLTPKQRNLQW